MRKRFRVEDSGLAMNHIQRRNSRTKGQLDYCMAGPVTIRTRKDRGDVFLSLSLSLSLSLCRSRLLSAKDMSLKNACYLARCKTHLEQIPVQKCDNVFYGAKVFVEGGLQAEDRSWGSCGRTTYP